jgi:hypothetical protein
VVESIEGYQMTQAQKERMAMVRSHLDYVTNSIAELDENWISWSNLIKVPLTFSVLFQALTEHLPSPLSLKSEQICLNFPTPSVCAAGQD